MGIPFQIPAKSVKDKDKPGCKKFRFIIFVKHLQDYTSNGRKKTAKKSTVIEKIGTQLFGNRKDKVSVVYVDNFERHGGSTFDGIFIDTGRIKAVFAAERNKF